jgi:hypothetical protein
MKSLSTLVAVAAFAVVGFSTDVVFAQGCCKAGLCRIPQIPSNTASATVPRSIPSFDSRPAAVPASQSAGVSAASVMEMTIANPVGSTGAIEYVLDGKSYTLEPGMSLSFRSTQPRKIEFKRGAEATAKYRVSRGMYEFAQTDRGWELYRSAAN